MDKQAEELNKIIKENNHNIYDMLSKRGKSIFFPKKGILSQGAEAKGKEINATIGTALEDNGEPLVLSTIAKNIHLTRKEAFEYAPSYGLLELRKTWKEMLVQKNQSLKNKSFSNPVVTCALTHGISMAAYMFADDGDEILVPDPYWENYDLIFQNAYNAKIKTFQLFQGSEFNIEGLKQSLESHGEKKILLLNFPNNPTGFTPTIKEMTKIIDTIKHASSKKKIIVLIDDAYFGLVFEEGVYNESIFQNLADLSENVLAVKLDGATKEDYVWGFRVGFMTYAIKGGNETLYKALEDKTAGAIRGNISNAPMISQSLILHSFKDPSYQAEKLEKYKTLKKRYDKVKEILHKHPEYNEFFTPLPFNSGYFMCVKTKLDAEKIRQKLLQEYSTGVIVFGHDIIRIAFSATPYPKLEKLFQNLYLASKNMIIGG